MTYRWRVIERDSKLCVASGDCQQLNVALTEGQRYAHQYLEDGPVILEIKSGRKLLLREEWKVSK